MGDVSAFRSHVRQRSSISAPSKPQSTLDPDALPAPAFSRINMDYGEDKEERGGEADALVWTEGRTPSRASRGRMGLARKVILGGAMVGLGWGLKTVQGEGRTTPKMDRALAESCNGYAYPGILLVNTSSAAGNRWEPVSAPAECTPLDFLTALVTPNEVDIEFARGKTMLVFGDSVDRDHVEHFCQFVGGEMTQIRTDSPISPPYPKGEETAPEGYVNAWDGSREWPNNDQSRPQVCYVRRLNFVLLNTFHYGFFDSHTDWIRNHPHFYPPATISDRFDQIVVPLLASLAAVFGTNPVPDIISITPGYWGLLRMVSTDDIAAASAKEGEDVTKLDAWAQMSAERRSTIEDSIMETIRHIADAWPEERIEGKIRRPKILFRALHHIKEHHSIPFTRVQSLNMIGRRVVQRLNEEAEMARLGDLTWRRWIAKLALEKLSIGRKETESIAAQRGLDRTRLEVDDWGSLMLGQQRHFRDDVHPLPLPGSWLYGNMLFNHLKRSIEDRERAEVL